MDRQLDLLEAALDKIQEAIVILDTQSNVVFWNKSAEELTGHLSQDVLAKACTNVCSVPWNLLQMDARMPNATTLNHKAGHSIPVMLRACELHHPTSQAAGTALFFYPIEEFSDSTREDSAGLSLSRSHAEMDDRLAAAQHQWMTGAIPFGLLTVTVDQAESLRKTHGQDACESMLRTVHQTLSRQMKPAETMGRWGDSEFLVITHEHTPELLGEHAQRLAGVARTADFRWWGDRVGLTVSIGSSFAAEGLTVQSLLDQATNAMHSAIYAGGNQVAEARSL